jgi:hypothetical protein
MRKLVTICAAVGAAAFLLSSALTADGVAAAAQSADQVTLSGVVRDRDGNPVANEFVQLNAGALFPFTYTNADGEYSITAVPGSYSLRLAAFSNQHPCGHDVNATGQLELAAGETTLDLTLPNLYLDVSVRDSVGLPVADANVTVENYGTTFEVAPGITMAGGTGCTSGVTTNASGVARLSLFASVSSLVGTVRLPTGLTIPFTHGPLTTDSSVTVTWSGRIDTMPPSIVVTPPNPIAEASGPGGAVVNYLVTAVDALDPTPTLSCSAASGQLFPLGDTQVECAATDTSGNAATRTFVLRVVDTTPPLLTVPSDTTMPATGPDGATVTFEVTAHDLVDQHVDSVCTPASGSTFPINPANEWTEVTCEATDDAGNGVSTTFRVHVQGASEQIADLIALVESYELGKLGTSLRDKLIAAQRFLAAGKPRQAEDNLSGFIAQVSAQRGKALSDSQSDALAAAAHRIIDVIET